MASRVSILGDIATVRTLSLFRDRPPAYSSLGNASILTIKDLTTTWPIDFSDLPIAEVATEHLPQALKSGEILMPARGDHYPARYIANQNSMPIFPAGQIHVVTANPDYYPGYLAWYLNQAEAQASIRRLLTGTNIQSLNKSRLVELPIEIPLPRVQRAIAEIQEKHVRRIKLLQELIKLKDQEVEAGCLNLLRLGE